MKKRNLFGHVQCDIVVPGIFRTTFDIFHSIFRTTLISRNIIGDLMGTYAEEEGKMFQPRKLLMSSFTLQNGNLITHLLSFCLLLGLLVTKTHRLIEYTLKKCFNGFVQAAVDARRKSS